MSRPSSSELSRLSSLELRDDNDDDPVPEDIVPASTDQLMSMRDDATNGNLYEFEKKFIRFEPTEQMWEMRMLLYAKAGNLDEFEKMFKQRVEPTAKMWQMRMFVYANAGNLNEFEKMFNTIKPTTAKMWEMRMSAFAHHYHHRLKKFQMCLEVANDMQKHGFQPTDDMHINLLRMATAISPEQQKILEDAIKSWSTASNGGRPKMRRQILTQSRHRLNKSKKNRRRKVRRTRHRNRSYS